MALAIVALLIAAYALIAALLGRFSISPAMVFVAAGLLLSQDVLGLIGYVPPVEPVKLLAEATLTLLLFADASTIRLSGLRQDLMPIVRLLAIGLPLTILLGVVGAGLLFPGIGLGIALLLGSTLAPTDAALGQPVITNPSVPVRIRRILNVESGLNDGIATPFVFLGIALTQTEVTGRSTWLFDALVATGVGTVVGLVVGYAGGRLITFAVKRGWASSDSRRLFILALAFACYFLAVALAGNGFIAAFLGGLAFGRASHHTETEATEFSETQGALLAIGVWLIFGVIVAREVGLRLVDPLPILYAILSLTVIRMLPVAISLIGSRFNWRTILFIGWFGPRGLASIVFLVIGIEELHAAGVDGGPFASTVVWTVLLSVIAHGLSAQPLAVLFGKAVRALPADAEELGESPEPRRRRSWGSARAPAT